MRVERITTATVPAPFGQLGHKTRPLTEPAPVGDVDGLNDKPGERPARVIEKQDWRAP